MLNFYVGQGMVFDKIHERISFEQSKWLEKNINFNTQNEIGLKKILKRISTN